MPFWRFAAQHSVERKKKYKWEDELTPKELFTSYKFSKGVIEFAKENAKEWAKNRKRIGKV